MGAVDVVESDTNLDFSYRVVRDGKHLIVQSHDLWTGDQRELVVPAFNRVRFFSEYYAVPPGWVVLREPTKVYFTWTWMHRMPMLASVICADHTELLRYVHMFIPGLQIQSLQRQNPWALCRKLTHEAVDGLDNPLDKLKAFFSDDKKTATPPRLHVLEPTEPDEDGAS